MATQSYKVLLLGGIETTVGGVQSITEVDKTWYDSAVYRDLVDVSTTGAPDKIKTTGKAAQTKAELSSIPSNSAIASTAQNSLSSSLSFGGPALAPLDGAITETVSAGSTQIGASDDISHVAPRQMMRTRTQWKFWSGATGSGDLLFMAWADEVIGFSIGAHAYIS